MTAAKAGSDVPSPPGFRVDRTLGVGRHPILAVFPGLDQLGPAGRLVREARPRARLFRETSIELVDEDMWMYVAPWELPPFARARGWEPVVAPNVDCIVVGLGHLRDSPDMILFLDIFHELCHLLQRRDGANLWEPGLSYVERRTEVDAYRFVVDEAHALGVPDDYLREYLKVEWITKKEHEQLLAAVGVGPPARSRAVPRS